MLLLLQLGVPGQLLLLSVSTQCNGNQLLLIHYMYRKLMLCLYLLHQITEESISKSIDAYKYRY